MSLDCNHNARAVVIVDDDGTEDTVCRVCVQALVTAGIVEQSVADRMRVVEVDTHGTELDR